MKTQLPHTLYFDGSSPGGGSVVGRRVQQWVQVLLAHICGYFSLVFCLFFFTPSPLPAQNAPHPSFRQYTTDDGLPSSETYQVLQDHAGYIWIATDNGVSRFDGYSFRNYGVKDGLRENVIFMLQLDTLGRLWMQAMSGNLYYLEGDTILPYWHNKVLEGYQDRLDVCKGFIVEGAGETVHIATFRYGVITISGAGEVTNYPIIAPGFWQVFEKGETVITALSEGDDAGLSQQTWETLWQKKQSIPVQLQLLEGQFTFTNLTYTQPEGQAAEVFRLKAGKYLLKIASDAWLIERGKIQWQLYFPENIDHAELLDDGTLMLGLSEYRGLKIFASINDFRLGKGSTWLAGRSVSHFLEDRNGGLWLATNDAGVFYAPSKTLLVYDQGTGLPDNRVTALTIKNDHELYAGFRNGAIWQLDKTQEKWTALPKIPEKGAVNDLYFSPLQQQLWAGLVGLSYLKDHRWYSSANQLNGKLVRTAERITPSPTGERLWLSNFRGFTSLALPSLTYANLHRGYSQRTYTVREDYTGRVWVGRPAGLFEWVGDTLVSHQQRHPAFSLRIEDLVLLPDSTLVLATKGGGIVYWKGDQFEQITTAQGLTADMLECLHADAHGVLWAGTLNGLNRISGTWGQREVTQLTVAHGLPSNEINRIRTQGDDVWIATNKGLIRFRNHLSNNAAPPPSITGVLANNQLVNLSQLPLCLSANQNNLTINFTAINYTMDGHIPYRFRMDEGAWTTTTNRSLNFPELSPGERCFEVQAQNEDGVWSAAATLKLVVLPPWWATWWARSIALLALALVGFVAYKSRTRQLKRAHKTQLQIAELERAALQAQMNPHFIFNCLNSIQNFILQNDQHAAILYLGNFASLVRSMLNASVAGRILLTEEVDLLDNYLKLEQLRFKNRFTYTIKVAPGVDVLGIKIPPLLVQPYVENAVKHGISDKVKDGKVGISFAQKMGYLEVVIEDNGAGMATENGQPKNDLSRKSFGMSITRNRLHLLSGKQEPNTVKCIPLYDTEGRVAGTQVVILIWLAEHYSPNKREVWH